MFAGFYFQKSYLTIFDNIVVSKHKMIATSTFGDNTLALFIRLIALGAMYMFFNKFVTF
jgi:hypothetical protein